MKTPIFSVYDEKAQAFLPPFYLPTEAVAKRAMNDCLNDEKHQFAMHTADYTLFKLGDFDNVNGEIFPEKKMLCSLLELTQLLEV